MCRIEAIFKSGLVAENELVTDLETSRRSSRQICHFSPSFSFSFQVPGVPSCDTGREAGVVNHGTGGVAGEGDPVYEG